MKYILSTLALSLILAAETNKSFNDYNNSSIILEQKGIKSINNSFNNLKNTVVLILNKLGRDTKEKLVDNLTRQMIHHFNEIHINLDKLKNSESFQKYIAKQIKIAYKQSISLREQLKKSEKLIEKQLQELQEFQKINKNNDYILVLQKAEKALKAYDEESYRKIIDEYQNSTKMQKHIKNYANGFYLKAQSYYRDMDYQNALLQIKKAVIYDKTSVDYFHFCGQILTDLGKFDLALEYLQKALEIKLVTVGENHPSTIGTYNNIGTTMENLGKFDLALAYYQKIENIYLATGREIIHNKGKSKHMSSMRIVLLVVYNNMGSIWQHKKNYDLALDYYEKSLYARFKILGENDLLTAQSYHNIASIWEDKENHNLAIKYYQKALEIKLVTAGENHPSAAKTYGKIGSILEGREKFDEAIVKYKKALEIQKNTIGENHYDTATTYAAIASALDGKEKYNEAFFYFKKALTIQKNTIGEEHRYTALTYRDIGLVLMEDKKYDEASFYLEKALTIQKNTIGEEDQDTAVTHGCLAILLLEKQKYKESLNELYIAIKILPENHYMYKLLMLKLLLLYESILGV